MWLKKNRRKGFTMVELIVVLGIIGVLSAIILPMLAGSGKPQEADSRAKSFYYASQNIFIDYKSKNPKLDAGYFSIESGGSKHTAVFNNEYYFVVAEAVANEGFKKITVAINNDPSLTPAQSYKCLAPTHTRIQEFTSGELLDAFNSFSTNDDTGYYYALVDWQCRVIATYWASEPINVLSNDTTGDFAKNTIFFTDNNKVDYTIVGAFPTQYAAVGKEMFTVE